jgi:hypothetical protein
MRNIVYVTPEESKNYIKLQPGNMYKANAFTRIPDGDGWDTVIYLAQAIKDTDDNLYPAEYVYVLVNISMPSMVKIGMTTLTPEQRAHQISSATGVPTPWEVAYSYKCFRSDLLEAEIHNYFSAYRVNNHREMFSVSVEVAQKAIDVIGKKYSGALKN